MFSRNNADMARRRVMPYNSTRSSLVDAVFVWEEFYILTDIAGHLETVAAYTFSRALTSRVPTMSDMVWDRTGGETHTFYRT